MPSTSQAACTWARRTAERREPWSKRLATVPVGRRSRCRGLDRCRGGGQSRRRSRRRRWKRLRAVVRRRGRQGRRDRLVLKGEFDGGDLSGIAVGDVGDVAFFDFAVLAEGFAEVDGLVGFAVGGGPASAGNVHVHTIKHYSPIINRQLRLIIKILHVYIFRAKIDLTP